MPLDPSIILQGSQANAVPLQSPLDAATKAYTLKSLASRSQLEDLSNQKTLRDLNDDTAMRQAYANNTQVDSSGNPTLNRQGLLSDLAKTSPALVPKVQQQMAQQQYETLKNHAEVAAQTLGGVSDQNSYDQARQVAQSMGYPTSNWPSQYDPNFVQNAQYQAMTAPQRIESMMKQQGLSIEAQKAKNDSAKLGVEMFKTFGAPYGGKADPTVDPATLVSHVVPPDRQKDVTEEIKRAQNVSTNGPKILEAFNQSANDNTVLKTGGGLVRTPGSVNALHQLLLPNFKTIDGTVRQAAMDETFHNVTPQPGDTDAKIAQKKKALQDWLLSESAAPAAKTFRLDLSKYNSTRLDPSLLSENAQSKGSSPAPNTASIHPALQGKSLAELQAMKAALTEQSQATNGK